jgi:hypothetical protein
MRTFKVSLTNCQEKCIFHVAKWATVFITITALRATINLQNHKSVTWIYASPTCHVIIPSTYKSDILWQHPLPLSVQKDTDLRAHNFTTLVTSGPALWPEARNFMEVIVLYLEISRNAWRILSRCVTLSHTLKLTIYRPNNNQTFNQPTN